jgi:hypothetical protein
LVRCPLIGLLYQPRMIDNGDYGTTGGIKIGRGNRSTREKPTLLSLCPPQIPHDHTRARTREPGRRGGKPATNRFSYGHLCTLPSGYQGLFLGVEQKKSEECH